MKTDIKELALKYVGNPIATNNKCNELNKQTRIINTHFLPCFLYHVTFSAHSISVLIAAKYS